MHRPRIAITLGDPAGIGPEIVAGVWNHASLHRWCLPLVIGHPDMVRRAVQLLGLDLRVSDISSAAEAADDPGTIPCLASGTDAVLQVAPATVDARAGRAAYDAIAVATHLALTDQVDAIVTAPLNKAALHAAGYSYPGHTETLAALCGVQDVGMMLYLGRGDRIPGRIGLGIVHATLHTALRNVFEELTSHRILVSAQLAHNVADRWLLAEKIPGPPRIGICALNPHAGEDGLFGDEEQRIIRPAVEEATAAGLCVVGPLPADTLMPRGVAGEFDAIVAMYHDQGHVALKSLDMHRAVNITLGLPILRTSVAHGTAFDLAWQGKAETSGMLEAVRVAAHLVQG
ncbi:MAG: 4-hydroxythreonine-4-phosphate dehydrogenase PdxA [Pirellulales bacterium]